MGPNRAVMVRGTTVRDPGPVRLGLPGGERTIFIGGTDHEVGFERVFSARRNCRAGALRGALVLGLALAPLAASADIGAARTILSGLDNPRGLGFAPNGALYVLEIAQGQVPPFRPPSIGRGAGRLKRQCPGGAPEVLLDGLTWAAGVAIGPDGAAYITNYSAYIDPGEVLRLPLTACHP
jgi:hypothetical protein